MEADMVTSGWTWEVVRLAR